MSAHRVITHRNIALVYVYSILTLGIYGVVWLISTKRDINSRGGEIPTTILAFLPIVSIYWTYKYCDNFAKRIEGSSNTWLYFAVWLLLPILMPIIIQGTLNRFAAWEAQRAQQQPPQQQAA